MISEQQHKMSGGYHIWTSTIDCPVHGHVKVELREVDAD